MTNDESVTFIPGLALACRFYWEAVRPVLDAEFPDLRHSAALIGAGSEVLGFDTPMSSDHHWGPRTMLFLAEDDYERLGDAIARDRITESFRWKLPHCFLGYPTNFSAPNPDDNGTQLLAAAEAGPVNHRVEIYTIRGFFRDYLAFDIAGEIEPADWLTFGEQALRTITGALCSTTIWAWRQLGRVSPATRAMYGSTCWQPGGRASARRST